MRVILALGLVLFSISFAQAEQVADEFIRGYAAAIIDQNFPAAIEYFQVDKGVIYVKIVTLPADEEQKILKMLSAVKGVNRAEILAEAAPVGAKDDQKRPSEPDASSKLPVFLPKGYLFQPLLADPRWPHFSAAYQRYIDDDELTNVGATSFGESIVIYRFRGPWDSTMEFGIQAGVFAIFDLDADSLDLVNADYSIGIPVVFKKGAFSNQTRLFHQSSHLGDEFLLRGRANERVNLSYEALSSIFFLRPAPEFPDLRRRRLSAAQRALRSQTVVDPGRIGVSQ